MNRRRLLTAAALALMAAGIRAQPAAASDAASAPPAGAAAETAHAAGRQAAATADTRAAAVRGKLSYYGRRFAGRPTASGAPFDPEALTMAHRSLPFGTRVRVTNLSNGKSVVVRVNDRGPASRRRIGDVSLAAARRLGMLRRGMIDASLEVLTAAAPPTPR